MTDAAEPPVDGVDEDKEREEYLKHRLVLIEGQHRATAALDKWVLTLSMASIGVSLTFVKDALEFSVSTGVAWLVASWIFFGIAVAATLASFSISFFAYRSEIAKWDAQYRQEEEPRQRIRLVTVTTVLNLVTVLVFVIGVACLCVFAYTCISSRSEVPHDEQRQIEEGPGEADPADREGPTDLRGGGGPADPAVAPEVPATDPGQAGEERE